MADITASMIKDLREKTGAGPLDCKKALTESNGDSEGAIAFLREKGSARASKKLSAGRSMPEGIVAVYHHFDKRMAVIVEVGCETDFVAKNDKFQEFARDLALHISSAKPKFVAREEIPADALQAQKDAELKRMVAEGKSEDEANGSLDEAMNEFYKQAVLMEQAYIKDEDKTIEQLLKEKVSELGESIKVARFARFAIGENLGSEGDEGEE